MHYFLISKQCYHDIKLLAYTQLNKRKWPIPTETYLLVMSNVDIMRRFTKFGTEIKKDSKHQLLQNTAYNLVAYQLSDRSLSIL